MGEEQGEVRGWKTAIPVAVVISTPGPTRMAARCVLIPPINHYNMQYNSGEVYLLFRRQMLFMRVLGRRPSKLSFFIVYRCRRPTCI